MNEQHPTIAYIKEQFEEYKELVDRMAKIEPNSVEMDNFLLQENLDLKAERINTVLNCLNIKLLMGGIV